MTGAKLASARRAWRITLIIAIGLLAAGLAQIAIRLQNDLDNRMREHHATTRAQARLLASQSARLLESMDLLSTLIIKDLILHQANDPLDGPEVSANVYDHAYHLPESALLIMVDAKGKTLMSADATGAAHASPVRTSLFARHAAEGIAFLITRQNASDNRGYLVISRSMIDRQGRFRGIVAVAIADSALEFMFRGFAETGARIVGLIDEEGRIMLYWPQSDLQPRHLTDAPGFANLAIERILYAGTLDLETSNTIVATSQVPAFFLRVVVAADFTATVTGWKRRVRQTVGIALIACLLVGWGLISLYTLEQQRQALEAGLRDKTAELAKTNRELEQALDDVTRLSRIDPLTQLWNRRYLGERLQEEIARAERLGSQLSVALFDLDHFKIINDTYGHPTGDDVLRVAASVLRRSTRQIDLLSRYGGEEFLILMPAIDIEDAYILADRLRVGLSCKNFTAPKGRQFHITCSAGIAEWRPGDSAERLIARADQALYAAKRTGRNQTMRG